MRSLLPWTLNHLNETHLVRKKDGGRRKEGGKEGEGGRNDGRKGTGRSRWRKNYQEVNRRDEGEYEKTTSPNCARRTHAHV